MGNKFGKSRVDFEYEGKSYNLVVNTRLAIDLECELGCHPSNLLSDIVKCSRESKNPPMGAMSLAFTFLLKRAGVTGVDLDEVYTDLHDPSKAAEMGEIIGSLLLLCMPNYQPSEEEEAAKKPKKTKG